MDDLLIQFGYPLIVLVIIASGFGLPVPEDIPLLVTGLLCSRNPHHIWVMLPLVFCLVVAADCTMYWLGRRYGVHVPKLPMIKRFLDEKHLARAERAYNEHGGKTLFLARFLPGLRAAAYFTAGSFRVPFWKMLVFDGAAALISVPVIVLIGFFFANHFERVLKWSGEAQALLAITIVLCAAAIFLYRRMRRKRSLDTTG